MQESSKSRESPKRNKRKKKRDAEIPVCMHYIWHVDFQSVALFTK